MLSIILVILLLKLSYLFWICSCILSLKALLFSIHLAIYRDFLCISKFCITSKGLFIRSEVSIGIISIPVSSLICEIFLLILVICWFAVLFLIILMILFIIVRAL